MLKCLEAILRRFSSQDCVRHTPHEMITLLSDERCGTADTYNFLILRLVHRSVNYFHIYRAYSKHNLIMWLKKSYNPAKAKSI